jgi:hypothetical protein
MALCERRFACGTRRRAVKVMAWFPRPFATHLNPTPPIMRSNVHAALVVACLAAQCIFKTYRWPQVVDAMLPIGSRSAWLHCLPLRCATTPLITSVAYRLSAIYRPQPPNQSLAATCRWPCIAPCPLRHPVTPSPCLPVSRSLCSANRYRLSAIGYRLSPSCTDAL